MDKNMIHIDDFVRQKLRDREEPERPGAWLTMRELLDREMPTALPAASFNWQRMLGYITGLLLLSCASVGGYKLYMQHSDDQKAVAANNGVQQGTKHKQSASLEGQEAGNNPAVQKQESDAAPTAHDLIASTDPSAAMLSTGKLHSNTVSTDAVIHNGSLPQRVNTVSSTITAGSSKPKMGEKGDNSMIASASGVSPSGNDHSIKNTAVKNTSYTPATLAATQHAANTYTAQPSPAAIAPSAGKSVMSAIADMLKPVLSSASATSMLPTPKPVRMKHDTIQRIEIVYHRVYDAVAEAYRYRLDTFPLASVVVAKAIEEPVANSTTSEPAKTEKTHRTFLRKKHTASVASSAGTATTSTGIPALTAKNKSTAITASSTPGVASGLALQSAPPASNIVTGSNSSSLSSLANAKVGNHHFRLFNAEKLEAMVEHVKTSLDKVQVYPGIMGGINASLFTPNSLGGFQAGITALIALNDWWTVMTELKYFHRFNTGSTLRDDYRAISDSSVQDEIYNGINMKRYSWKDDSIAHYFNYDIIRTLEVPVALRYNWGRFYAMGGVNLVYSLAIQSSEVTRSEGRKGYHSDLRPYTHSDEAFDVNDAPLVRISDFGARFGTGYLLGGGYMFSPGVYVDLRLAQTFWDNAGTAGSKQVSKDLLHTPSFQLAVGYRFNKKKQ